VRREQVGCPRTRAYVVAVGGQAQICPSLKEKLLLADNGRKINGVLVLIKWNSGRASLSKCYQDILVRFTQKNDRGKKLKAQQAATENKSSWDAVGIALIQRKKLWRVQLPLVPERRILPSKLCRLVVRAGGFLETHSGHKNNDRFGVSAQRTPFAAASWRPASVGHTSI